MEWKSTYRNCSLKVGWATHSDSWTHMVGYMVTAMETTLTDNAFFQGAVQVHKCWGFFSTELVQRDDSFYLNFIKNFSYKS